MAQNDESVRNTRGALSFEDFIEAATAAAVRATAKVAKRPDGTIDDQYLPYPIWVGIIIRDRGDIKAIGNPVKD